MICIVVSEAGAEKDMMMVELEVVLMTRLTDTDTLTMCRGGDHLLHSTSAGLKAEKAQPGLEAGRLQFTSTLPTSPHSPPTWQPQPHTSPPASVQWCCSLFTIPADEVMSHLIFITIPLTILTVGLAGQNQGRSGIKTFSHWMSCHGVGGGRRRGENNNSQVEEGVSTVPSQWCDWLSWHDNLARPFKTFVLENVNTFHTVRPVSPPVPSYYVDWYCMKDL